MWQEFATQFTEWWSPTVIPAFFIGANHRKYFHFNSHLRGTVSLFADHEKLKLLIHICGITGLWIY